jgi:uncharacterized RDD family membrane protein YckC
MTQQPPTYESAPPPPAGSYSSGPSGPRSGFWRRFGAWIIDAIIIGIVELVVFVIFRHSAGARGVLNLVISLGYGTLLEGSARGQTVGKMALGIRVYDFRQGGSIGYGRAFIRQIVKIISALVIFLGYLWMLWDKEKQCWHDKAANDVVVPVSAYS